MFQSCHAIKIPFRWMTKGRLAALKKKLENIKSALKKGLLMLIFLGTLFVISLTTWFFFVVLVRITYGMLWSH